MSIDEAERYVARWAEEPPVAVVIRTALGVKLPEEEAAQMQLPAQSSLTQAEYDELVANMKANAEAFGRRRN